ncbi:Zinc finger protein 740 [Microtus ochrogaster]|uniref:Zinc finger protein 740 n=1 Tax=Microtus ochrogaster TaxID=79684 RepID=A0A8J6GVX9_MICOH|nr:Zinc finger protein 740 [Microtus ochrogaster]
MAAKAHAHQGARAPLCTILLRSCRSPPRPLASCSTLRVPSLTPLWRAPPDQAPEPGSGCGRLAEKTRGREKCFRGNGPRASLLACEGLAGVSLVPTAASKKMMLNQIASKQAENGERAGSPDVLRCSSQGHRKDADKSRSRKDDDSLAESSHSKKTVKKAGNGVVVVEQNGSFQVKIPKNFICEHCFGAFRSSYHLKRHILIHTGEKPFECDVCDMRFIQKYHLERHKRVHSGEKPYQCERCHQTDYSDTSGCAKDASPRRLMGSFLYRHGGPPKSTSLCSDGPTTTPSEPVPLPKGVAPGEQTRPSEDSGSRASAL